MLAIREGIEAWRGDVESPFEVLSEMVEDDDDDNEQHENTTSDRRS